MGKPCLHQCQSCGMPLAKDPNGKWGGTEKDGSISTMWCSLCYRDGTLLWPDCTLEQMQAIVDRAMKQQGYSWVMRCMARWQLPHLARWKKDKKPDIWFVRKTYGWWRTPATRQGWLAVWIYIAVIVALSTLLTWNSHQEPAAEMLRWYRIGVVVSTVLLLGVCYRKGESPKRQWGEKK